MPSSILTQKAQFNINLCVLGLLVNLVYAASPRWCSREREVPSVGVVTQRRASARVPSSILTQKAQFNINLCVLGLLVNLVYAASPRWCSREREVPSVGVVTQRRASARVPSSILTQKAQFNINLCVLGLLVNFVYAASPRWCSREREVALGSTHGGHSYLLV